MGRLLQGGGSAFAFTGAVYLATRGFSARRLATAIGVTQCLGMLGGSASQVGVAPLIHGPLPWRTYWLGTGVVTLLLGGMMYVITPREDKPRSSASGVAASLIVPFKIVFTNPQPYLRSRGFLAQSVMLNG